MIDGKKEGRKEGRKGGREGRREGGREGGREGKKKENILVYSERFNLFLRLRCFCLLTS